MKRIAVIVIGSNSTRLLAADACDSLTNDVRGRVETRLFLGTSDTGLLSAQALQYTVQSVAMLARRAEETQSQLIGIYATSAARDAKNTATLSMLIESAVGLPLTVLTGEEEAAYSFFGACGSGRCGVIDIGGGSTEIVLGCGMDISHAHSLQLGASRLFKMQPVNSLADIKCAADIARAQIITLPDEILRHEGTDDFYLIGGTGTSSARVTGHAPEGCVLTAESIRSALELIAETPREQRASIPGFPPARIDILPTGMAVLLALFDLLHLKSVRVTERVNADGLLRAFVHKKFA